MLAKFFTMYLRVKREIWNNRSPLTSVHQAREFALSFMYLWRATIAACSFSFSAWVIPRNCHAYKKQLRSTLQEESDSLLCFRFLNAEQPVSGARVLEKGKMSPAFFYSKTLLTPGSRSSVFILLWPMETFEYPRFHDIRCLKTKR